MKIKFNQPTKIKAIQFLGSLFQGKKKEVQKEEKKIINLIDIKKFLQGRKWEELTEKEQIEISQKIADLISKESD